MILTIFGQFITLSEIFLLFFQITQKEIHFGVGNGDDLIYLFPVLSGTFRPLPHEDLVFSERFIKLLVSFVATGTPKLQMEAGHEFVWNPVQASNATHLNIGNEMEMDHGLPNHERMNFWQTLPVYWNSNRDNYAPAPPIVFKDELWLVKYNICLTCFMGLLCVRILSRVDDFPEKFQFPEYSEIIHLLLWYHFPE